jgi:hypothetical protein
MAYYHVYRARSSFWHFSLHDMQNICAFDHMGTCTSLNQRYSEAVCTPCFPNLRNKLHGILQLLFSVYGLWVMVFNATFIIFSLIIRYDISITSNHKRGYAVPEYLCFEQSMRGWERGKKNSIYDNRIE